KQVEIAKISLGKATRTASGGHRIELNFLDREGKPIVHPRPIMPAALRRANVVQRFNLGNIAVFLNGLGNVVDTEEGQAVTGGVLTTQSNSLVYYMITVNDVFAYFLTGTKGGGITAMPTQFPTTQGELNKITAFAALHGKTFPDPNALCIEVKSSWVEATA